MARYISKIAKGLASLFKNKNGSIAPLMALALPVVMGAGGLAMDFAFAKYKHTQMQNAADAAAMAATRELSVSFKGTSHIDAVVKNHVVSAFKSDGKLSIASGLEDKNTTVAVKLTLEWQPFFAQFFDSGITPINVAAKATLAGSDKICVLGLMPDTLAGVHFDNSAKLKADNCGVYSNSTSIGSLRTDNNAGGEASTFCAAGGYLKLGSAELKPRPVEDCPVIGDPIIGRPHPAVGACTFTNKVVTSNTTLSPGTYCGGLTISGNAKVNLSKGEYVIKDGPLLVLDNASMVGRGSGFYLTGADSVFNFTSGTHIDLVAPEDGLLAGLLFFEDQKVPYSFKFNPFFLKRLPAAVRLHRISSNNAKQLLGTIYLPKSILLVDANAPVASESAYTAIVTGRLWLKEGPTLILNSDYSVTDVPVPVGLAGGNVRLIQ